ncbi:MAG: DinB family protein [Chloroflexota bacterium]
MVDPEVLIYLFNTNASALHRQLAGLTHEESLLQLPFRGNCLNWVLGHIVESRAELMSLIGIEPIWAEERWAQYGQGSEPIMAENSATAVDFASMLRDYDSAQEQIAAWLHTKTLADMNAPSDRPDRSWGQRISFFAWHEGYHVGQTEQLRQLAGRNDRVIG